MRRYFTLLLLLCLYGLARGQTEGYSSYYWFDYQQGRPHISPVVQGTFDVDVTELSDGIHTFHYLTRKDDGTISLPAFAYFLKATTTEPLGQITCLCTIDGELIRQESLPVEGGVIHWNLDMQDLSEGLHQLQIDALKTDGTLSGSQHCFFVKVPETDTAIKGYYWFDEDTDTHEATVTNGTFEVDASFLSDGFHRFHYYAMQSNGVTSTPSTNYFLKTAQLNPNDELTCICSVDNQLRYIEKLSQKGGIVHWNLDMQDLTDGIHSIQLQALTPSGALSSTYSSYFMRVTSNEDLNEMYCLYTIDGNSLNNKSQVVSHNGSFHFDLDLSNLEEGLHYISFMLYSDRGASTNAQTQFFVKTPLGGNGITQYQYWLNDDDINQAVTVTLPEKVTPLQLMSLLPVESRPLRSSQFHFNISNGKPMIYAKNTIHLRFHDVAKRFSDIAKDYADYSKGHEVEPVGELQATQTFEKIAENGIRWYTMQTAQGDTVAFKLNQPATIQLFAPSGEEVFNTSESESVSWNGIHTWENGTYYLAVHDVTGSKSTMTLDYMHMDKNDVVDWDVHTVGNGGCSTITFEGNGFRDLYAVDLYNEQGDSIKHIFIGHESDATTSVAFDFTGAALGDYHAKFYFTEEDKVLTKVVTVEEARAIELATTVTYRSPFLRGTSTTYTIKITNNGNMTAYNVPLTIKISNSSVNDITHIALDGLGLKKLFDYVEVFDGWTQSDIEYFKQQCDVIGEDHYFIKVKTTDEKGDSIFVRTGLFGLNVPPNTTKTIDLTLTSSETVEVWAATAREVEPLTSFIYTGQKTLRLPRRSNWFCCHYEQINCFLSIVVNVADIAGLFPAADPWPQIVSCAAGAFKTAITASAIAFCNKEEVEMTLLDRLSIAATSIDVVGTLLSCAAKFNYGGEVLKMFSNGFNLSLGPASTTIGCVSAFTQTKPGCPPDPPHGGTSVAVRSMDPNDIYGYTAESTSKAVMDGLTDVYYRIEFENDTTFATAAAHDIYVNDTLDATKFDLTTFAPTHIKIGNKSAELTGDKNFVTTIDMRPGINAIAQVEGTYDESKGIAKWHITSLDPITMEPTDDVMQGVLPVNTNGQGIGEVSYDIKLKDGLAHGTEVNNRASIVFDNNEPIMTPTWTNVIDRFAPESHIADVQMATDSTATVRIEATDELSGPWRYDVYVQYGSGAWFKAAENVPIDTTASVKVYEGINHGFYVVVTDSAGNVEQKQAAREFTLDVFGSQVDTDTQIELAQGWNWISHNQQEPLPVSALKPASARMVGQTEELIDDVRFGWMGDLEELLPTQMYKVQMDAALTVPLSGRLFNAGFRSVPLYEGWNWLGYPVANTMTPAEALEKLKAEEGDMLIGQDGLATYSGGQWTGTLLEMNPGQGYMYRSASDKNLFYNATAQASSRKVHRSQFIVHSSTMPEGWTVDKRKYPNVMGVIAVLVQDETAVETGEWVIGAFCNGECRGLSTDVGSVLMMNVYGQGGEPITFYAVNAETGEVLAVTETEPFQANVLGTMQQPYLMHIGEATGISLTPGPSRGGEGSIYLLDGRRVSSSSSLKKGIYVVTDKNSTKTQKVIRP